MSKPCAGQTLHRVRKPAMTDRVRVLQATASRPNLPAGAGYWEQPDTGNACLVGGSSRRHDPHAKPVAAKARACVVRRIRRCRRSEHGAPSPECSCYRDVRWAADHRCKAAGIAANSRWTSAAGSPRNKASFCVPGSSTQHRRRFGPARVRLGVRVLGRHGGCSHPVGVCPARLRHPPGGQHADIYFLIAAPCRWAGASRVFDFRDRHRRLTRRALGAAAALLRALLLLERCSMRAADACWSSTNPCGGWLFSGEAWTMRASSWSAMVRRLRGRARRAARSELRPGRPRHCCWVGMIGPQDRVDPGAESGRSSRCTSGTDRLLVHPLSARARPCGGPPAGR